MSVSTGNPSPETRPILAPTGNRVRVLEDQRRKKEATKKPAEKNKKVISHSPAKPASAVVPCNVSADSSSDSASLSSSGGKNVKSGKIVGNRRIKNSSGGGVTVRPAKVVPDGIRAMPVGPVKRCDWITPNSETLYASFHDEEWGVPVWDDVKLFELLVYSQALAELSWPVILTKRPLFRKLFDDFDPLSVANLNEEKLLSMRAHSNTLLSEPKLRAVVDNAKQILKIQQEFGSFSNYCWRFVNNKPIKSGFCYARKIPAKTPKSEVISKDLMQRGFRCVGPTVVYSFMQAAGIVNDHLTTCFRYNECSTPFGTENNPTPQLEKGLMREQLQGEQNMQSETCPPK